MKTLTRCCIAAFCALIPLRHSAAAQPRDSAGTRIVSYARNQHPLRRWTLDPKPVLEIGGLADEGPTAFAGIVGAARLSDGRIAVANREPSEIRIFGSSGAFEHSLGRKGQGPGEFNQQLFRLARSGDSLIGIDNTMRAQIFAPAGVLLRSLSRPRPPGSSGNPTRIAFDSMGNAIVQVFEPPMNPSVAGQMAFVKLLREGAEGESYVEIIRVPAYRTTGAPPPANFVVYGPAGRVAGNGTRVCAGFSSDFTITCYDHTGRATLSVRRALSPRSIHADDRRFYRDMVRAGAKGAPPNVQAMVEETIRLTEFASRAPAFDRLTLSTVGDLWVSEFDRSGQAVGRPSLRAPQTPLRWSVFGVDGVWLSDIILPARFTPYEMGPDYVLGVSFGGDDVERITLYRIRR